LIQKNHVLNSSLYHIDIIFGTRVTFIWHNIFKVLTTDKAIYTIVTYVIMVYDYMTTKRSERNSTIVNEGGYWDFGIFSFRFRQTRVNYRNAFECRVLSACVLKLNPLTTRYDAYRCYSCCERLIKTTDKRL